MTTRPTLRPATLLKQVIEAATKLEHAASQKALRKPLQVAGLGFLVRNRRIARAIERLGRESAYESRVLLRTMLEIQINYAWIRLRKTHSRALRFHKYWPIERLRLLEKTATIFRPPDYNERKQALQAERAKVRHLFRFRDSQGKMQWAQSWASVSSVEARLTEVQKRERPGAAPDPFLYGMYISFSSATHGSPISLNEVLTVDGWRLIASSQPESRPDVHRRGAFILLAWTIEAFAEDARLRRQCRADMTRVLSAVKELKRRSKHLQKTA